MVVVVVVRRGNVLRHVNREGELSGREKCPDWNMSRGKYPSLR